MFHSRFKTVYEYLTNCYCYLLCCFLIYLPEVLYKTHIITNNDRGISIIKFDRKQT